MFERNCGVVNDIHTYIHLFSFLQFYKAYLHKKNIEYVNIYRDLCITYIYRSNALLHLVKVHESTGPVSYLSHI